MALHLNLLHEEILEQRQRQRDPLKIGMLMLSSCGALLFLYYAWNAYQTLEIKAKLNGVEAEWKKLEPKVTQAQKRAAELTDLINTTRVLDDYIDNRFFWGPFLEKLSRCVPPNAQVTSMEGAVLEDDKGGGITVTIDGVAAAQRPGVKYMLAKLFKQRSGALEQRHIAAYHDSERAIDCAANTGSAKPAVSMISPHRARA